MSRIIATIKHILAILNLWKEPKREPVRPLPPDLPDNWTGGA